LDSDTGKPKKKTKQKQSGNPVNVRWIATISITSFILSVLMSYTSKRALESVGNIIAFVILFAFIALGILFDIIGVASTVATEKRFHSMAARRVKGAKQAIWIARNAEKVGSFCNDVVGDISGIISGATSAVIITRLTQDGTDMRSVILSLVITGCVSSLTIGGKAIGKTFAISHSEDIVFLTGRVLSILPWKK
jgi:CBS domain containing-hemolysin-like protein